MDPAATINIGAEIVFSLCLSRKRSVFEVTTGCGDFRRGRGRRWGDPARRGKGNLMDLVRGLRWPLSRGKGNNGNMACACDSLSPPACRGKGYHGNMA